MAIQNIPHCLPHYIMLASRHIDCCWQKLEEEKKCDMLHVVTLPRGC